MVRQFCLSVNNKAMACLCVQDPVVPEQCAVVTEKLGEYLITVGYWIPSSSPFFSTNKDDMKTIVKTLFTRCGGKDTTRQHLGHF
jgi:hypothetical protein